MLFPFQTISSQTPCVEILPSPGFSPNFWLSLTLRRPRSFLSYFEVGAALHLLSRHIVNKCQDANHFVQYTQPVVNVINIPNTLMCS